MSRVYVDCRDQPSETNCSLKISGEPDEVVRAACEHAVSVHGHENTPELQKAIRGALREEPEERERRMKAGEPMRT